MLPSYLQEASAEYKLEKVRRLTRSRSTLEANVLQVYGSWDEYEDVVSVLPYDQRANYERAGIILQPKQIAFAKAARQADFEDTPDEIGIGGARGGGKSFSVFSQLAVDDCLRFPGLKALYLRRTMKAGQEQMNDLVQAVLQNVDCEPKATRIDYANGSRIVIGGFRDDSQAMSYQGVEYDVICIEELTQLSEHTYKTLRLSARSSKGWRPRNYNTFNPLGVGHMWVKKRFIDPFRAGESTSALFIPATVEDNVFNDTGYKGKLDELTGAELRAYRYGDWDVASGAYFETWDYDQHVIEPLERVPSYWTPWLAMDAGFNHWNIVLFGAIDTDGNSIIFHELAHRKAHAHEIGPQILNTLTRYGLTVSNLSFVVTGTDGFAMRAGQERPLVEQYVNYNLMFTQADMSAGSRIAGWQLISRKLGDPKRGKMPTLLITRNCTRLVESLPYLERDPKNPEDVRKWDTDEDGNGGDDAADTLRYGLMRAESYGTYDGGVMINDYSPLSGGI